MLTKSSTGNQKISCEFAIATLRNDATTLCSTQREQRRTYSPIKNPTPLFAPVIAATLPEGAAKAAAAAEDDMLASGCSWILLWLLDGSWMAMACRVGEVGEVAKLRRKVWPSNFEGTPRGKTASRRPYYV